MKNLIKTFGDLRKLIGALSLISWTILMFFVSLHIETLRIMLFDFIIPSIGSGIAIFFIKKGIYDNSSMRSYIDKTIELTPIVYAIILLPIGLTIFSILLVLNNDLRVANWASISLMINTGMQCAFFSMPNDS